MIDLIVKTLQFAVPILSMIFLGLFMGGLLMETGAIQRVSFLARPLTGIAHLPEVSSSSFIVSIGSAVAANGMIARFRENGSISDLEALLCSVMNSIPVYIRELFTYQLPVVIPALGPTVGALYGLVFIVTALVKISLVVILGRLFLQEKKYQMPAARKNRNHDLLGCAYRAFRGQSKMFFRIALLYVSMTFIVFAMTDMGLFQRLNMLPLAQLFKIPGESLVPLTTYVASPILGISLLGPMIRSGSISTVQAMTVLMLGSMFMLPLFALRSMIPNYTAIFGPRLGITVVAFSTGISIMVRMVALFVLHNIV